MNGKIINAELAKFAAALNDAYETVCDTASDEFFTLFNPVSITLHTGDGLTAKFYEEGIEFYPEGDDMNDTSGYAKGGYVEGDGPLVGGDGGCYIPWSPEMQAIGKRNLDAMVKAMGNYAWPPEETDGRP